VAQLYSDTLLLKLKLSYDRRSVSQSVLESGSHLESMTKFLFSVRQLPVFLCGASTLTRERVCNILIHLLLGLARAATVGFKPYRAHDHILLSHLRLLQLGGSGPHIHISTGTGFSFRRLLRLARLRLRYSNLSPQRPVRKLELIYDRRSVGQSVLVSGSHLEPMTRFLFPV
jgi:hypothetical protein